MINETELKKRQGRRLEAARKAAGYRSGRSAALDNGWPESSYRAHEAGKRTIGQDDAERYARRFRMRGVKITAQAILFEPQAQPGLDAGAGEIVRVPLVSWVSAGKMVSVDDVPETVERYLTCGDLRPGDWMALEVHGNSMDRVAPDGSIIMVNRADRQLVDSGFYVVALPSGESTFKRWRRSGVKHGLLQPYSTDPDHVTIFPVEGMKVVGRVRRVRRDL